jgi:uncharacterized protein (DUF885 family)
MSRTHHVTSRSLLVLALVGLGPGRGHADGVSETVARLCDDYWQGTLKASPTTATSLGDHRYDALLPDNSPGGLDSERRRLEGILARVSKVDVGGLSAGDRLTLSVLKLEAQNGLDGIDCHFELWVVDPLYGPQVSFMSLPDITTIRTPRHAADFVLRCRAMGPYLDRHIANLQRGLETGRIATHDQVRRVLEEIDALVAQPVEKWALLAPLEAGHDDWPATARAAFRKDLTAAVGEVVKPAMARYGEFLRGKVMPMARPQDRAGLSFLPGGSDCYRKSIRIQTSLDQTPEVLHQVGLEQVARFRRDLSELGLRALGTGDIAAIQKKLRGDTAMHFRNAAEVEAKAGEALARARAAVPAWFGIQPRTACTRRPTPPSPTTGSRRPTGRVRATT